MEHFIKGIANTESQISAIPPERYGDRFIKFISGVTKTKEAAEREKRDQAADNPNDPALEGININAVQRSSTDEVMEKAQHQADRSRQRGRTEENVPRREMKILRSPSAERGEIGTVLPVVEEAGESSSVGGRSNRSASDTNGHADTQSPPAPPTKGAYLGPPQLQSRSRSRSRSRERDHSQGRPPPTPPKDSGTASNDGRPPTPPKDPAYLHNRHSGPPTPPKEMRGRSSVDKELPRTPLETTIRVRSG
jgi:1-phosphatidylinositol-4-phosphate 5-kinase